MKEIILIKIGGNIIDDEQALNQFLHDFSSIHQDKILIHGGGKLATQLSETLQIKTTMIDGRRVTDEKTLDVVTMVYAGLINKKIVAQLQAVHCNSIGLTGVDASIIEAHKRQHPTIDYGFVGDIDRVQTALLSELLSRKITPVIAPITHDKHGQLLNTNADAIAAELAIEFSKTNKVTFIYCFEKKGLQMDVDKEESVVPHVRLADIQQLKDKQIITGGMLPKIDNISRALENGVEKVILCHAQDMRSILHGNSIFGTIFTS